MEHLKEKIRGLPVTSGVYLYKDAQGEIIYIGKAVNVRSRVTSYLRPAGRAPKTDVLVRHIADIDVMLTASEAEALLLEASLIKKHQPIYNVELKDGKTYPFIRITREDFPLISIVRLSTRTYKDVKADFYGPYVGTQLIREALSIIRKIFPFRSCEPFADKLCMYYHIGLCQGPCEDKTTKQEYNRNIRNVRLILDGKKDDLFHHLRAEMETAARAKNFEAAARLRDQIRAVGALYSGTADVNYFKEAEQLQRALDLPRTPNHIECFDISNIMGNQAVGSMVSFLNGKPDKRNYRRFRIKTVEGIDDFQMMAEVVRRRYTRLKNEGSLFPDLILIDGGKGQLGAAMEELKKLDVHVPIVALAKQEEELFLPGRRNSVLLPKDSLGLNLVRRVRDEAHRFALNYHRLLRAKNMAA